MRESNVHPERQPLVREGVVVLIGYEGVLRVSLGPGGRQSDEQRSALDLLRSVGLPPIVGDRVPWPVSAGAIGLGRWTLERRLEGEPPAGLTDAVWAQCLEFLVTLHGIRADGRAQEIAERAEVVARAVRPEAARRALLSLGERLDTSLARVPRGFAHGDFYRGNLLVDGDRLTGVVDWDNSGGGRLPLLDLYHLWVNEERPQRRSSLGRSIVERLLPAVASGEDPVVRDYCARIRLDPAPSLLVDLALAYWLDFIARELELYGDRANRARWLQENVYLVIDKGARCFG
jgi:aminoglycoside phosphotransferase (APT) family kinase protein